MNRTISFAFLATLVLFPGCSTNIDKCQCTGILCDSPCSVEAIKSYRKMAYFSQACQCTLQIPDQTINVSHLIPNRSFPLSPKLGNDSLFIEMNLDPNTVSYSGDTVFYDTLIPDPFYPERDPKAYSFFVFEDGMNIDPGMKRAWLRRIKIENIPDDAGASHGVKATYQFRAEWNGSWLSGEVVETTRDML